VSKVIQISPKKREEKAKKVQTEVCYQQREKEIYEYQKRNPFSYLEWWDAYRFGWLRQHGLNLFSFPSPFLHYRNLFRYSEEEFFKEWRDFISENHREYKKKIRKEK